MIKKTVLITGASRGIGAVIAEYLVEQNWRVVINYFHSKDQAKKIKKKLQQIGGDVIVVRADVSSKKGALKIKKAVEKSFGHLDAIINNVGMVSSEDGWNISTSDFQQTMMVNLYSVLNVSQELSRLMKKGVIINISSLRGILGAQDILAYAAAKAGVINITKSLAKILAPNIRVNCIALGRMNIGMSAVSDKRQLKKFAKETLVGRVGLAEDIKGVVEFLLSEKSSFITGQTVKVDGGLSLTK